MPAVHDVAASVARRAVHVETFEEELQAAIRKILEDAEKELLDRLRAIDITQAVSNEQRVARLKQLYLQVADSLGKSYDDAVATAQDALSGAAGHEIAFSTSMLESALAPAAGLVDVNTVAVSPELLAALARDTLFTMGDNAGAAPVADWLLAQEQDVLSAFRQHLQQGVFNGESIGDITDRISGGGRWPGIMPVARGWAEAVVRTSVTAVTNSARAEVYRANDAVVKGVTQVSTRDNRTTIICIAYHGKSWHYTDDGTLVPDDHDLPYNNGVPRHVGCRSSEIPWVKSWEEMGFTEDEVPASLRNYLDGETLQEDGNDILSSRGEAFQDELLGPTRAQLWRDGKIDLGDLLDSEGRVRPVSALT